ncbi:MAG: aminotransferase class I/II-fold pyridoxal phosphate-dependent enzyme [Acidobacteria bacterium]|nr:aminotransferase class I/II-fold pyridoxal phosphate-dependent enzyme [Acidobacteriota bacterium]MCI0628064.1 aminotransferase class I/II-fold pyridoxal phosphate-dependent enzyme [Acidobacteriota bacterium]MCI0721310.1 aminotransferase class I/II-fold pyridoxal phosphate-dependent enzyme [Acidobacteriota bacterium]
MAPKIRIDLFSDTMTKPTAGMRRFMCEAEVGDEQKGEDPTVNLLQEMTAELLGKEAALFLPSGTMCNQIAIKLHCRPGDEVLLDRTAHPLNSEAGGPAVLAGAIVSGLPGERGVFTAEQVKAAVRPITRYQPKTRLVSVEQTANMGGGTIWPLRTIQEVCAVARQHHLFTHMDGARLFNAVIAAGISAKQYAADFDSAWVDLSKGLGAPVGAVLTGSKDFILEAWQWKQRLGGAMRQAGIIAAAGVYALKHHVERLAEDHAHAKLLAEGLAEIPGLKLNPKDVETNIVIFDIAQTGLTPQALLERFLEHGLRMSPVFPTRLRAVTHLDVSRAQVEEAAQIVRRVLQG